MRYKEVVYADALSFMSSLKQHGSVMDGILADVQYTGKTMRIDVEQLKKIREETASLANHMEVFIKDMEESHG